MESGKQISPTQEREINNYLLNNNPITKLWHLTMRLKTLLSQDFFFRFFFLSLLLS